MATINVSEETYQRLSKRAAEQNVTVDDLVEPVLGRFVDADHTQNRFLPAPERMKALYEWMEIVRQRASRYPAGFVVDDSRESIYAGRGE